MPRNERKSEIDWLGMENEIRDILGDRGFRPADALRCIDEIVARYTGRGNSMSPLALDARMSLQDRYPKSFDWNNKGRKQWP